MGPAASSRWVLLRIRSKGDLQKPSDGHARAALPHGGPRSEANAELQHHMEMAPSSPPGSGTSLGSPPQPRCPLAVVQRSMPRRKMQLQLFAFCLSGIGLEVLKTYICVSLDAL